MDKLLLFIAVSASITLATTEIKKLFALFTKFKVGLIIAQTLGIWAIFSFGLGLLSSLGIVYDNVYFQYFDLFTTAFIVAGGAGVINKWSEIIQSNKR